MNYFVALYQVLNAIKEASHNEIDVYTLIDLEKMEISSAEFQIIIDNIFKEGLVVEPDTPELNILKGSVKISKLKLYRPHLTTHGYKFLEENSDMKKAYKLLKEIKGWIPGLG